MNAMLKMVGVAKFVQTPLGLASVPANQDTDFKMTKLLAKVSCIDRR